MKRLYRRGFLTAAMAVTATARAATRIVPGDMMGTIITPAEAAPVTPAPLVAANPGFSIPVMLEPGQQMHLGASPPPAAPQPPVATPTLPATAAAPRWQRYAVARPTHTERPAITIVVDDLGVMHPATERVIAMPGPLTLSWFPFAKNLPDQVARGLAAGHEATLHMPMQSFGLTTAWTGPDPLRVDLPPAVNLARLRAAIEAVPNTVGLNNHMGSVATKDPALMALVAAECKAQSMLFLDSVVIPHSQGYPAAHNAGVPAASRDYFIDHSNKPADIREQLMLIEAQARRLGHVIAIGHPWPHTVAALEEWLPTLKAKGFDLWPLSAMVARRNDLRIAYAHS